MQSLQDLSLRLTPRDFAIATLLDEHQVLSTTQLTALLFNSEITCRHRLQALKRLKFIDRFSRSHAGENRPLYWVPGPLSAAYVYGSRGENPPTLKVLAQRLQRITSHPRLGHLLGVNGLFVKLLVHARHHDGPKLTRWWSEFTTTGKYAQRIRPDGHGVWTDGSSTTGFYLEYDTGSEPLHRLIEKLPGYRRLKAAGGPAYPVLFVLPSRAREQHLHRRLAAEMDPGVNVATTSHESGDNPAAQVWRLFGNGRARYTLAGLSKYSSHGQEDNPLNPGPPTAHEDPLRIMRPDAW